MGVDCIVVMVGASPQGAAMTAMGRGCPRRSQAKVGVWARGIAGLAGKEVENSPRQLFSREHKRLQGGETENWKLKHQQLPEEIKPGNVKLRHGGSIEDVGGGSSSAGLAPGPGRAIALPSTG